MEEPTTVVRLHNPQRPQACASCGAVLSRGVTRWVLLFTTPGLAEGRRKEYRCTRCGRAEGLTERRP